MSRLPAPAAEPPAPKPTRESTESWTEEEIRERDRVHAALEQSLWVQTEAAKRLGIARSTLVILLDKYNLPRPRKKSNPEQK